MLGLGKMSMNGSRLGARVCVGLGSKILYFCRQSSLAWPPHESEKGLAQAKTGAKGRNGGSGTGASDVLAWPESQKPGQAKQNRPGQSQAMSLAYLGLWLWLESSQAKRPWLQPTN